MDDIEPTQSNTGNEENSELEKDAVCVLLSTNGKLGGRLVLRDSDGNKEKWRFGRNPNVDFCLGDVKRFSNVHFEILKCKQDSTNLLLKDTSTNGTYLNHRRIPKNKTFLLTQGDQISVGMGVAEDELHFMVSFPTEYVEVEDGVHATYDIKDTLGKGAFAVVKKALHRETGELYAIKMIDKHKVSDSSAVQREIKILKQLQHKYVVSMHEFIEDENYYYLVMDYVSGGDLMDFVVNYGSIDEEASREIIRQVVCCVKYFHNLGISHRDLKPDNILIASDSPVAIKISDFGLAKISTQNSCLKTFCGTLSYLAPEVLDPRGGNHKNNTNSPRYSNLVDMWSIGCVAFVILTGYMPFDGSTQEALQRNIREGKYNRYILDKIEASEECKQFIDSVLQVNPVNRPAPGEALKMKWLLPANGSVEEEEDAAAADVVSAADETATTTKFSQMNIHNSSSVVGPPPELEDRTPIEEGPDSDLDDDNDDDGNNNTTAASEHKNGGDISFSLRDLNFNSYSSDNSNGHKNASRDDPDAWLKLLTLPDSVPAKDCTIVQEKVVVGRKENNDLDVDIPFDERRISRLHCFIQKIEYPDSNKTEIWLLDYSTNGCFVNGKLIGQGKRILLQDGDELLYFREDSKANGTTIKLGFTVVVLGINNLILRDILEPIAMSKVQLQVLESLKYKPTTNNNTNTNNNVPASAKRTHNRTLHYNSQNDTLRPLKKEKVK